MTELRMIIGLEQHVQLATKSKLFCGCKTDAYLEAKPNTRICEVCCSLPGAKPWGINEEALRKVIKIALALNCNVRVGEQIFMQRKHYFYPDAPSNYQRTTKPIGIEGELAGVRIREVHMEEDPGRYDLKSGRVDYNRSGMPLIEIVTEPDITSPEHARKFLDSLQAVLEYLNVARSEPGSTRTDANSSFEGYPRIEVKNINSFKGVLTALSYEAVRQKNLIKNNVKYGQETRHFDEAQGITIGLRKKETAEDYRYIPDPDVPPIVITKKMVDEIAKEIPELPAQKQKRFMQAYGLSEDDAFVLTLEQEFAQAYEEVVKSGIDSAEASKFMQGYLRKQLNYRSLSWKQSHFSAKDLAHVLTLLARKQLTVKSAEQALIKALDEKTSLEKAIEGAGLLGITSSKELEEAIAKVMKENAKAVEDFKAGNEKSLHFLAGQVMRLTKGKASPQEVQELLKKHVQ